MNDPQMTSYRPYLMRALYEWIADNDMTPHILVDAGVPGVRVPKHVISDGKVVLNIAERAVARLQMDNECIRFSARFGGAGHQVNIPINAILAIYARETGQGMALPADVTPPAETVPAPAPQQQPGPVLVKTAPESPEPPEPPTDTPPPAPPAPPSPPRGRAHLKVVK